MQGEIENKSGKKERKEETDSRGRRMGDWEEEGDKENDSHVTTKTTLNTTKHPSGKITTDAHKDDASLPSQWRFGRHQRNALR